MSSLLHLLSATIAPHSLDEVVDELRRAGIWGITVTEVHSADPGSARAERYRGAEYVVGSAPLLLLQVVVETFDAERLADLVAVTATGGGHVWLSPVERIQRIRTGERGVEAL